MAGSTAERLLAGVKNPPPRAFRSSKAGRLPRRMTLDLSHRQYEALKELAAARRVPGGMTGLLRAVIDVLERDEATLEVTVRRAKERAVSSS